MEVQNHKAITRTRLYCFSWLARFTLALQVPQTEERTETRKKKKKQNNNTGFTLQSSPQIVACIHFWIGLSFFCLCYTRIHWAFSIWFPTLKEKTCETLWRQRLDFLLGLARERLLIWSPNEPYSDSTLLFLVHWVQSPPSVQKLYIFCGNNHPTKIESVVQGTVLEEERNSRFLYSLSYYWSDSTYYIQHKWERTYNRVHLSITDI